MNLEKQCVSLELAKKLKELGVKQESLFYWYARAGRNEHSDFKVITTEKNSQYSCLRWVQYSYSAFTVAELGEMLPDEILDKSNTEHYKYYKLHTVKFHLEWQTRYQLSEDVWHLEKASTEADARAKMLIYLIKNKLITI